MLLEYQGALAHRGQRQRLGCHHLGQHFERKHFAGQFQFGLAQRDSGKKHRQKAPGVQQDREAIDQANQTQAEKIVHQIVLIRSPAQLPHAARQHHARCHANRNAGNRRPQHIDQHPAQAVIASQFQVVQAQQPQAQHHKREGAAIVHACLRSQRETQLIAVTGVADLHIGGQHGVRRRDDGTEQNAGPQRQAQQPPGKGGHHRHGERH